MVLGDAAQGGKLSEAGIGEDNVDSPPFRLDGFVELIKVNQLGDVSLDAGNIVPMACTASSSSFWRRPVMKT